MKKSAWFSFIGLLLVGCLPLEGRAQDSVVIPPVEREAQQPKMLVLKPVTLESYANADKDLQELYDLLLFDLRFSGAFDSFEQTPQALYLSQQDETRGAVDYAAWKNLRVKERPIDYLVKTLLIAHGPDAYELRLLVYDIVQSERAIGKAYGVPTHFSRKQLRTAGHTATAEVISTLSSVEPITQSKISFVNYNSTRRTKELYLIDYDGWEGSLSQLTYFNSTSLFPKWSPDGEELAYVSFRHKWADAFIQNVQTGEVTTLAKFRGSNTNPSWFPDGEHLAISLSAEGNFELYKIHRNSYKDPNNRLNPERLTYHQAKDITPDVSPDGSRIVFTSDRGSTIPQIHIMNADGSDVRRISFIDRQCDQPVWSPIPIRSTFGDTVRENYRIAFTGFYAGDGQSDIFTMNPDGTDTKMLTDGKNVNENPTWSPNGQYIAFSSNLMGSNKYDIFLMSTDPNRNLPNGKRFHRVTYMAGDNLMPDWSPN